MEINRNNYESFFILYTDNELPVADKEKIDLFIVNNPDLKKELDLFKNLKLIPEQNFIFNNKSLLLKPESEEPIITSFNCESFFILYADNELTINEKIAVENFVYKNPLFQHEFEIIQQARITADNNIIFENKSVLYRKQRPDTIIVFKWLKLAVAAILLLSIGFFWLQQNSYLPRTPLVKKNEFDKINIKPLLPALSKPQQQIPIQHNETNTMQGQSVVKNKKVMQQAIVLIKQTNNTIENRAFKKQIAFNVPQNENVEKKLKATIVTSTSIPIEKKLSIEIKTIKERNLNEPSIALQAINNNWDTPLANESIEVLNTTINKKNALRELIRKTSRFITKKTHRIDNASARKKILIAGFEIALN